MCRASPTRAPVCLLVFAWGPCSAVPTRPPIHLLLWSQARAELGEGKWAPYCSGCRNLRIWLGTLWACQVALGHGQAPEWLDCVLHCALPRAWQPWPVVWAGSG